MILANFPIIGNIVALNDNRDQQMQRDGIFTVRVTETVRNTAGAKEEVSSWLNTQPYGQPLELCPSLSSLECGEWVGSQLKASVSNLGEWCVVPPNDRQVGVNA